MSEQNPADFMEPSAEIRGCTVHEQVALSSIAISLKRIADRLELISLAPNEHSSEKGQLNVGCEGSINVALNG